MKNAILYFIVVVTIGTAANASVPVSVLSFKNKIGNITCQSDWEWWRDHLGSAFKDMLLTELGKNDNISLLERENIEAINDRELNLVNSEKSAHKIEKGHFTKAKYTIVGAVSSYEYCADKRKINVGVSQVASFIGLNGLAGEVANTVDDVGISNAHAKVVIDVRVIETQTGRIIKTVKAEGDAKRSNFKVRGTLGGYSDAMETPVGEAARNAIEKAATEILPSLTKKM